MSSEAPAKMGGAAAVTGAGGYVGSRIAGFLRGRGVPVIALSRDPQRLDRSGPARFHALEGDLAADLFHGVDLLVHCAYDFRPTSWRRIHEVNVLGSRRLLRAAEAAGVSRRVLISTMSSFPGCRSLYGRAKLEIEREAGPRGAAVIRPGLVFGPGAGGMIGTLQALVDRLPWVPVVGSGDQVLYLAHADDLCGLVGRIAELPTPPQEPVIAACERGLALREILRALGRARGRRVRAVPVPWRLVHAGIRAAELAGVPLRIRSDSVVSLVNQDPAPDFAPTRRLGAPFREFDARALAAGP